MIAPKVVSHVQPTGRDYSGTTAPDLITGVPVSWKPGTTGAGTVNGERVRGFVGKTDAGDAPMFVYWNPFTERISLTGTVPSDFAPDKEA